MRSAAFPFLRATEEFDLAYQSTLRLTTIRSLLSPNFITEGGALIFEGKSGRGETHLAVAIGHPALQNGFDAPFTTAADLINDISAASREGRLRETIVRYVKPHLLVVDEVGYLTYGNAAANVPFPVVNERHFKKRDALHDEQAPEALGHGAPR